MELAFLDGLVNFVMGLSVQYPVLVGVFAILYSVGIALKLIFSALDAYVLESPSKSDDTKLAELKGNKVFKVVKFAIDLLVRFKVK